MATQRGMISIEVEKDENKYVFLIPMGSPLGSAYDACFDTLQEIISMSKTAAEKVDRHAVPAEEAVEEKIDKKK